MNRIEILVNIDNPAQLEKMYRENKSAFKMEFNRLFPELSDRKLAAFWNERLNYEHSEISLGRKGELALVIILALLAGIIAKFPALFNIQPDYFYQRNIAFIIFPVLSAYFIWRRNPSIKTIGIGMAVTAIALIFINLLPDSVKSDTLILSCIHLPLLLWAVLGYIFTGEQAGNFSKRLEFLRYNGDMVIMTTLLGISGVIFTGLTFGLFSVIDYDIEEFYSQYIAIFGAAALPVIGTFITQNNPQLVNKVSPVIAKIFSPVVLVALIIYLVAIIFSGKDPYNDRDFLIVFNLLLIGVMAIILFSIAATFKSQHKRVDSSILLALSVVTIIVNGIALSAILFRIAEWGMTPNRLAVLGANVLMLTNLILVTYRLFKSVSQKQGITEVENSISLFLPVYVAWTIIVTFIFPFLFQFR